MDQARQLAQSQDLATKVAVVFNKRAQAAQEKLAGRVADAYAAAELAQVLANPSAGMACRTSTSPACSNATARGSRRAG